MNKKTNTKSASPRDLKSTMRALALFRGLSVINEQLDAPPSPTGDAGGMGAPPAVPAPTGDAGAVPPAGADTGAPAQITAESLVEIFNEIRAGRSFDDPAVYASFNTYFNATPEATRKMLDTELRKIAEVVKPANAAQPEANQPPAPPVSPAAPQAAPPTPAQPAPGAPPVPTL